MPQHEPTYPKPPFAKQQQPWPGLACFTAGNVWGSTGGETGP